MLYTSYIANIKNIPDDYYKLVITRFPPSSMKFDNNIRGEKKLCSAKILSPHKEILLDYKEDDDWEKYTRRYLKQLKDPVINDYLDQLIEFMVYFNDIVLLCYEKNSTHCHRRILADHINNKYGIKVRELYMG